MPSKRTFLLALLLMSTFSMRAAWLLVPMDETQKNHLKAYGIAYYALGRGVEVKWLLNYRGGSFPILLKFRLNVLSEGSVLKTFRMIKEMLF